MGKENLQLPKMWQVIFVLFGFLAFAFGFTTLGIEIHLALFCGWFLAIAVGKMTGHSYDDLQKSIIDGIYNGIDALILLLVVGALVGTWISGGIVPSLIYYGLKIIHPSIFLVATFIICSITSLSTGTSWGSAGTAGIAMMGVGAGLGVPAPITAGAVLSGSYFGDKLSPLSDSTILSASMSKVKLFDHVKGMIPVSIPAYIITAIAYTIAGFIVVNGSADLSQVNSVMSGISDIFNVNLLSLLPMIIVIVLLAKKLPAIPVISFGVVLGIIWAIILQGMSPVDAISTAWAQIPQDTGLQFIDNILSRGGMESMLWSVGMIILGLGFGGLLEDIGILTVLTSKFEGFVTNGGRLTLTTIIVGFLSNLFGSAMYVSLILTPKIMGAKYDELNIDRRVLSRNTEFGGTLVSGMIPWSDNGIYMSTILGVSTLSYLPYMWFAFACIAIAIFYGYTNKFNWSTDAKVVEN